MRGAWPAASALVTYEDALDACRARRIDGPQGFQCLFTTVQTG